MIKQKIIGLLISFFYQVYASTFRYELVFEDENDREIFFRDVYGKRPHEKNLIFGFFHQAQIGLVSYFEKKKLTVLVSPSRDGEILATILDYFGMRLIRGSSNKNPKMALLNSIEEVKNGYSIGIAVDGPRGPAFVPKDGIIRMSQETKRPIVPLTIKASKYYIFSGSWDKSILPYPFSKVSIIVGKIKDHDLDSFQSSLIRHITKM